MTQYLISFDDGAMNIPEEEMPDVAKAAQEVVREARGAGVWVFGAGLGEPEGERRGHRRHGHRRPVPGDQGGPRRLRGRRRAAREEALEWAAKIAAACRCAQEVGELLPDPPA